MIVNSKNFRPTSLWMLQGNDHWVETAKNKGELKNYKNLIVNLSKVFPLMEKSIDIDLDDNQFVYLKKEPDRLCISRVPFDYGEYIVKNAQESSYELPVDIDFKFASISNGLPWVIGNTENGNLALFFFKDDFVKIDLQNSEQLNLDLKDFKVFETNKEHYVVYLGFDMNVQVLLLSRSKKCVIESTVFFDKNIRDKIVSTCFLQRKLLDRREIDFKVVIHNNGNNEWVSFDFTYSEKRSKLISKPSQPLIFKGANDFSKEVKKLITIEFDVEKILGMPIDEKNVKTKVIRLLVFNVERELHSFNLSNLEILKLVSSGGDRAYYSDFCEDVLDANFKDSLLLESPEEKKTETKYRKKEEFNSFFFLKALNQMGLILQCTSESKIVILSSVHFRKLTLPPEKKEVEKVENEPMKKRPDPESEYDS